MNYKHLSQVEKYQIYSLMKANQSITQIAEQLGRHKSTISRELGRNEGCRGYSPKQVKNVGSLEATTVIGLDHRQAIVNVVEREKWRTRRRSWWERGSNENFTELQRQYWHKKRKVESIMDEKIKMIECRLKSSHRILIVKPCCTSYLRNYFCYLN